MALLNILPNTGRTNWNFCGKISARIVLHGSRPDKLCLRIRLVAVTKRYRTSVRARMRYQRQWASTLISERWMERMEHWSRKSASTTARQSALSCAKPIHPIAGAGHTSMADCWSIRDYSQQSSVMKAKALSIMRYQDDIYEYTEHNMKSICRATVAQWTKRLTRNGYTRVRNWKGANILLLHEYHICAAGLLCLLSSLLTHDVHTFIYIIFNAFTVRTYLRIFIIC